MKRKAILVGANVSQTQVDFDYSMQELENLAEACGVEVLGHIVQNLHQVNKKHYVGAGKVEELGLFINEAEANIVIADDELSPSQIRNLESALDCEVIDRTMLILEIFANRAKTKESKLQVESARLKYMLPRLVGMREDLGRQGGGVGLNNRGSGETKIELDRRKIEEKISALNKDLVKLADHRKTQRKQRKKNDIPVVSLVGYTNAGKSTLMNVMLNTLHEEPSKQVFAKDMLFATLETSVRNVKLKDHRSFLLTDTVGFINKLPHHLVKAFRSTLEEVIEADLLLHVIDSSNPYHEEQRKLTEDILSQLGAGNIPVVYVYNKVDLIGRTTPLVDEGKVYLSAKQRIGMEELTEIITNEVLAELMKCEFLIPYVNGEIVSYFTENSTVLSTEYKEEGTHIIVECQKEDAEKFNHYLLK
ncbi:GTPase HflX [Cytobacillus purgationiresistens]|uniref:GTPase HflX n=1 Tax=Cytobacillus purgationiresistens TaxID=863449 RepID=A0ABU0AQH8_9BACI|nr:GTPase HflX [Cytobacillus purgationiresistens]MDQ0272658.1 GTP-binding protein HflX [Cytobacillus purgationiresistens]